MLRSEQDMTKITSFALFLILIIANLTWGEIAFDPETWISVAEEVLAGTESYTTIFHKQERLKGIFLEKETIYLKFKKPFNVYMKWIAAPNRGRELLYVDGWNKNRLKAHEGGILGIVTLNLDPRGAFAMKNNRHPVTDTGLEHLVRIIAENVRRGVQSGSIQFIDHGSETVYGSRTRKFEGILPKDRRKGYYCYRAVINVDIKKKVPVKIMIYNWDDNLIENYGYEDLRLDAGLTDSDFTPDNPEYKY